MVKTDNTVKEDVKTVIANFDKLYSERQENRKKLLSNPKARQVYNETDIAIQVAKVLSKARQESHLTQTEIAKRLHTTQSSLARIENGQNITLNTLAAFAAACGKAVRIQLV
jgi:ribosome-binding protein aMBF1 (putative translation factor)